MVHTPHLLGASYLVLLKKNQVLLQRRFQTGWMDGFYSLPAGHTEPGEPFTTTLHREVKEEIGITLAPTTTKISHILHRSVSADYQIVDVFFTCTNWEGEPSICEPEKCDDLTWFPLEQLPENTIPYIKTALQNIQSGIVYSEDGWK